MIASLRGAVVRRTANSCILEVGGVGYRVNVTPEHALELREGAQAHVLTHLVVREDAWTLYGFRRAEELEVFEHLIGVTGVGPKSAQGVLSQLDPEAVARAVAHDDAAAFKRVSGIGPKTAQLIILSLAGKLPVFATAADAGGAAAVPDGSGIPPALRADVVEALVGLGYAEKAAGPVVDDAVAALEESERDVATILRAALRLIGPGRARA